MLWYVEEHKPPAIRRHEVVDCFDEDLDCLIAGIHFDANLSVFKIYFVSTTIAAADDGVRHVSGSPWLPAKKATFLNLAPEHLVVACFPKNVRLDLNDTLKEGEARSAAWPTPQIGGRWGRRPGVSYGIQGSSQVKDLEKNDYPPACPTDCP
jgi:hypothetical protein